MAGPLLAQAAPDLAIGDVSVHRVIDLDPFALPLGFLFPDAAAAALEAHRAELAGHVDLDAGTVLLAVQTHVVRTGGLTILVDTCVGEGKPRPRRAEWNDRAASGYLDRLAAAGCRPEDVDVVMCTHLHADHVGWNTRREDGRWVPTFPRARYVMGRADLEHWSAETARDPSIGHGSFLDSVLPIVEAGRAVPVQPGDDIAGNAAVIPLPGHSPGQVGLDVATSAGTRLVFCGDAIHSPAQVIRPEWSSAFCCDAGVARDTRTGLLERAAADDVILIPAHLRSAGLRVHRTGGGFRPACCGRDGRV